MDYALISAFYLINIEEFQTMVLNLKILIETDITSTTWRARRTPPPPIRIPHNQTPDRPKHSNRSALQHFTVANCGGGPQANQWGIKRTIVCSNPSYDYLSMKSQMSVLFVNVYIVWYFLDLL